jgi:hypothetical protein
MPYRFHLPSPFVNIRFASCEGSWQVIYTRVPFGSQETLGYSPRTVACFRSSQQLPYSYFGAN